MADTLLGVRGITKTFASDRGPVYALDEVSLDIPRGKIVGLVGESGSGKTTFGRVILRLVAPTSGTTTFDGIDLDALTPGEMRQTRRRMQIIFQDSASSINPRMKVGDVVAEGLVAHRIGSRASRIDRVAGLMEEVGLKADDMQRFPHEFSGGQRQRIGIARALALDPEFIVADEIVSALDVSIQAQMLNLLLDIRKRRDLTMLFIAHDLSVVEYLCDITAVMYLGRLVEIGASAKIHGGPAHPYTRALVSAVPHPGTKSLKSREILQGDIPSPLHPPSGCVFRTRCRHAKPECGTKPPILERRARGHEAACIRLGEIG